MGKPKWKSDSMRRYWQERRGRRRRRDRRQKLKTPLLMRLLCFFAGHEGVAFGFRHKFKIRCGRCLRYV